MIGSGNSQLAVELGIDMEDDQAQTNGGMTNGGRQNSSNGRERTH